MTFHDFFYIAGLAAVVAGVAMLCVPAAFIVGGVLLAWTAWDPGTVDAASGQAE